MLVPYSREQRERGSPKQQAKGQARPRAEKAGPGAQPPPPAGQDSVLGPQGQLSELLCGPSRLWKEHDLLENRDPWLGCERVLQPLTWWRCGCRHLRACMYVRVCVTCLSVHTGGRGGQVFMLCSASKLRRNAPAWGGFKLILDNLAQKNPLIFAWFRSSACSS